MPKELEKHYQPGKIEAEIYKRWLPYLKIEKQSQARSFRSGSGQVKNKRTFIALMAPPNITGTLHLGHAFQNVMIDVLVRYFRMKGYKTVWLPGTDHASIATQNVVEKELKKEGKTRFDLGREKFIERVWQWRKQYGNLILEQFKQLGITPDWSRVRFTLDPEYVKVVEEAFVNYYQRGWIYRACRPVNFCPRCQTSLSDLEIDWREHKGELYYVRYPLKDRDGYIIVATTRPETMLGDVALAVNPQDKRYQHYLGERAVLPLVGRPLLIVSDKRVDPQFGTGVLKITPAHSLVDYEIAVRHSLPMMPVIDSSAQMMNTSAEFDGLHYLVAREQIVQTLKNKGYLDKIESYEHSLPFCDRCGTELQVVLSQEWFLRMHELSNMAMEAVRRKKVKIIPERFKQPYFNWLKNVRDWCISRRLWWGQTLPVWYCSVCSKKKNNFLAQVEIPITPDFLPSSKEEDFVVSRTKPKIKCSQCQQARWIRTEEVFDTWFSSALWPFAIIYKKQEQNWYPADLVSSARDILHLWITRMIFSGLYFKDKEPFRQVFIHPTILTQTGKRMSKSLGTGIDPLDLIKKYGADSLRFGLLWQAQKTQDIRFNETVYESGLKFANKIWNAVRFYMISQSATSKNVKQRFKDPRTVYTKADQNILKAFGRMQAALEKHLLNFEFSFALQRFYKFFWHEFCDVYLESCKQDKKNNPEVLAKVLRNSLKLLSLFMPFLAEHLWQKIGERSLLLLEDLPD